MKPENFISLGSFLLGLFTSSGAALIWYANAVKKQYAAERDFQHLLKNQSSISSGIAVLTKELESDVEALRCLIAHETEIIKRDIYAIRVRLEIKKINEPEEDD